MANEPAGDPSSAGVLPRDVARIVEWARGRGVREPVDLPALARIAGVAPRTLETHFRRFLGKTPLAWVRDARLARAREILLAAGPGATVGQVAVESGFGQLGRFAALYCRRFGELPSETLRRLRSVRAGDLAEVDDDALRLAWRALPAAFAVAPGPCGRALEDAEQALELAPGYALPRAIAAWCRGQRAAQHFGASPAQDSAHAVRLAEEAARLAPTDGLSLTLASGALTLAHRLAEAERLLDRALALDPGSPWAWVRRAWASAYAGDAERALAQFRTTLHLMPFEPIRHLAFIGIGLAHFVAGRHERAARWARDGVDAAPDSFWAARVVAAAAAHAGSRDEARRIVREVLRRDPDLTVAVARRAWPFPPRVMDRLADGLLSAGMPRE